MLIVVVIAMLLALTVAASRDDRSGGCALCYGALMAWAAVMRCPGVWLGARLGVVARHGVGWFASVVAGAAVILAFHIDSPNLLSDIKGGLGAGALIYGIGAASIVEVVVVLLSMQEALRVELDDDGS